MLFLRTDVSHEPQWIKFDIVYRFNLLSISFHIAYALLKKCYLIKTEMEIFKIFIWKLAFLVFSKVFAYYWHRTFLFEERRRFYLVFSGIISSRQYRLEYNMFFLRRAANMTAAKKKTLKQNKKFRKRKVHTYFYDWSYFISKWSRESHTTDIIYMKKITIIFSDQKENYNFLLFVNFHFLNFHS